MFSLIFIKNGFADHPGLVEAGACESGRLELCLRLSPCMALTVLTAWRGFSVNPAVHVKKGEDDSVGIDEAAHHPDYTLATDLYCRAVVQKI